MWFSCICCIASNNTARTDNVGIQNQALPFDQPFFLGNPSSCYYCTGDGNVFLQAGGTILQKGLRTAESLYFDSSCIVACESTCRFGLESPAGIMGTLFGLKRAIIRVHGPGKVYFSTQSIHRMARSVTNLSVAGNNNSSTAARMFMLMTTIIFIVALASARIVVELGEDE